MYASFVRCVSVSNVKLLRQLTLFRWGAKTYDLVKYTESEDELEKKGVKK